MIGVVDHVEQRHERYSWNSANAMCYHSYDGSKYPGKIREGNGFDQGDVVEVVVNRSIKSVKYLVNNVLKAEQRN